MRRDRLGWAASVPKQAASEIWDRMVASDPGLLRLLMAFRGTASVFLMTVAAILLSRVSGAATVDFAAGVTLSILAPFLMREPTRRQRERTLLLLALPAAGLKLSRPYCTVRAC